MVAEVRWPYALGAMPYLLVLAFADEHRSAEVLATLQRLRGGSEPCVDHAVSVVRRTSWTVKLQHVVDLGTHDASANGFWAGLVATLILAPNCSSLRGRPVDYGIESGFAHALGAALPPGGSGVFMIAPRRALDRLST